MSRKKAALSAKEGFTLIEVLLAIGISALVLACAYSGFRLGWLSYQRLNSQSQAYHNLRSGLRKFSKDLRNSFLFSIAENKAITLSGNQKEVSFATLIRSRDKQGAGYVECAKALYKFEGKNLLRGYVRNAEMLKDQVKVEYEIFLTDLAAGEFAYAIEEPAGSGQLAWKNSYEQKDAVPKALRLKLTCEIPHQRPVTFTKSIPLEYEIVPAR